MQPRRLTVILWISLFLFAPSPASSTESHSTSHDILAVAGTVTNTQGKPIKDAEVAFFPKGGLVPLGRGVLTSPDGTYRAEFVLSRGTLSRVAVDLQAVRPAYRNSGRLAIGPVMSQRVDDEGNAHYLAQCNIRLSRIITPAFGMAGLILVGVYALIAFDVIHRTLAAFAGAALMLAVTYTAGRFHPDYFILGFDDAVRAIDMNVILLLLGMMIVVGVLKKTGVFQWIASRVFHATKGNVFLLAAFLMFATALLSAFLDNVTTMLLVIPVTIEIAVMLGINPVTLLVPEAFASNVGGTATLIGDPPNIMIGSYARLTFMDFAVNLTGICLIVLLVTIVYFLFWYKREYGSAGKGGDLLLMIRRLKESYRIADRTLLVKGVFILGATIFLFVIHGSLKMEPSIAAMIGAAALLVIGRVDMVEMLEREVEWPTLIFFMMLFIVVAGAENVGLIQAVADWVRNVSKDSLVVAVLMILWVSAFASAIIDNIPFTATMLPIVAYLTAVIPGAGSGVLWWALALGACLGGNGTMIGASANVVTVGTAERAGYRVSFMDYFRIAFLPMIISILLCSAWLLWVKI